MLIVQNIGSENVTLFHKMQWTYYLPLNYQHKRHAVKYVDFMEIICTGLPVFNASLWRHLMKCTPVQKKYSIFLM